MDVSSILGFIVALIVVLLVAKFIFKSAKLIVTFLINAIIGFIVLWVLNKLGLGMPINLITSAVVGFFGIPGIIILALLKFVLHVI